MNEEGSELHEKIVQLKLRAKAILNRKKLTNAWKYNGITDNMTDIEVARRRGKMAGNARKDLENEIVESVVGKDNELSYQYVEEDLMIENK